MNDLEILNPMQTKVINILPGIHQKVYIQEQFIENPWLLCFIVIS